MNSSTWQYPGLLGSAACQSKNFLLLRYLKGLIYHSVAELRDMKRNALLLLSQLISVNIWAQSVYMHEAQEESEGTNIFDTLLGFAIFASIIWAQ